MMKKGLLIIALVAAVSGCKTMSDAFTSGSAYKENANDCGYENIEGKEFYFVEPYAGVRQFGYDGWAMSLESFPDNPDASFAGKRGKLDLGEKVSRPSGGVSLYWEATMENCQKIYARASGEIFEDYIIYQEDMRLAESLVGEDVYPDINALAPLYRKNTASTEPKNLPHLSPVTVTGHKVQHGNLYLLVEGSSGVAGRLPLGSGYYKNDPMNKRWSEKDVEKIRNRVIFAGMTGEQLSLSWGEPKRINRSTSAYGTREQWVYGGGQYVYLENGKVDSWQTSQ